MAFVDIFKPERPIMKVCMMGPKAVGKTTVLTAVFNEMQKQIAGTELNLIALGDTNAELITRQHQLTAMFKKQEDIVDNKEQANNPQGGIAATAYETRFDFSLGFIGKDPIMDLEILDFPGENVVKYPDNVKSYIKESQAVFLAVDTPHLMERDGDFNGVKNKPDIITQLFSEAINSIDSEKLIVFIPLKCEKYLNEKRMPEIIARIEQEYQSLIDLFKCNTNICCTIAPILTLGGVEFEDFSYHADGKVRLAPDDCPENVLYRYAGEKKYAPLFCSQPLYALLSFVAAQYKRESNPNDKNWLEKIKSWIWRRISNDYASFFNEILKLEKTRIASNMQFGYKVLCGINLFHYNF